MMYRKTFKLGLAALGTGLILSTVALAADDELTEIRHPLCDGPVTAKECARLAINYYGPDNAKSLFDRIEARVENTCTVELTAGGTAVASTEELNLSDVHASSSGVPRIWWFPKGCKIWFHSRYPFRLSKDMIVSETLRLDRDVKLTIEAPGDDGPVAPL